MDQNIAQNSGAIQGGIYQVEVQLQALNFINIDGGYDGGEEMQQALTNLKETSQQWQPVKEELITITSIIVQLAKQADLLKKGVDNIDSAFLLQMSMRALHELANQLTKNLDETEDHLESFNTNLKEAIREAKKTAEAVNSSYQAQLNEFNQEKASLESDIDDFNSAKSIVIGVFTGGTYTAYKLYELNEQYDEVKDLQARLEAERNGFLLATFFTDQLVINVEALAGIVTNLSTAVQQPINELGTTINLSSPDVKLMKIFINTFADQFVSAAEKIDPNLSSNSTPSLDDILGMGKNAVGLVHQ